MFQTVSPLLASGRRAMTLVEVVISLALMILLSLITVTGMIMHARTAQSNLALEQIAEESRRFLDTAQIAALDSTIIRVDDGPSGAKTVLTIGRPDDDNPGTVVYKQFAYLDRDNNPATIRDNVIVQRDVNTPTATTGKVMVRYCSLIGTAGCFQQDLKAARPLYNIVLRVGDRTSPANSADNAITGRGYQSLLISSSISQL